MYRPGTLNVSNMISAVSSLFSGAFNGGSVSRTWCSSGSHLRYLNRHLCHNLSMLSQFSIKPCLIG